MLYKPNFCCNCGEKIDRIDWNVLTSRRFCQACYVENKKVDYLPRAAVGLGLLSLVFGLGAVWSTSGIEQRSAIAPEPVMLTSYKNDAKPPAERESVKASSEENTPANTSTSGQPAASEIPADEVAKKPAKNERAYFCGARTKKGTPCSRKVKTSDTRCFQHEGKPSVAGEE